MAHPSWKDSTAEPHHLVSALRWFVSRARSNCCEHPFKAAECGAKKMKKGGGGEVADATQASADVAVVGVFSEANDIFTFEGKTNNCTEGSPQGTACSDFCWRNLKRTVWFLKGSFMFTFFFYWLCWTNGGTINQKRKTNELQILD